jgi:hypothetical protein
VILTTNSDHLPKQNKRTCICNVDACVFFEAGTKVLNKLELRASPFLKVSSQNLFGEAGEKREISVN